MINWFLALQYPHWLLPTTGRMARGLHGRLLGEDNAKSPSLAMERGVLEKLLRQAEPIRLSSLNTPEIQVV
jgi:hypothetical protein